MGPFLGCRCQGPGTCFKAASLLKNYTPLVSERELRWLTIRDTHTQHSSQDGRSETYQGQVLNYLVQILPALQPHGFLPGTDRFHTHLDPQGSSFRRPELDCCPRSWG